MATPTLTSDGVFSGSRPSKEGLGTWLAWWHSLALAGPELSIESCVRSIAPPLWLYWQTVLCMASSDVWYSS